MRGAKPFLWAVCAVVALAGRDTAAQQRIPDKPRQRWEDFYARRAFPFDRIPPGALQQARLQLQSARLAGAFAPPPISGTQWQPLGPEAIPIFGTSIGRISAIAVHPTDANTVYIGGAQGGVWKTTNGGTNWTPLTDNECSLAMGSIALDPVNPDIIYAGTGEQHLSGDSYYGCGVLRSENGGATWVQTGANVFALSGNAARISRIGIVQTTAGNPATTTVLAASSHGVFRSLDGGASWTLVQAGYATDLVIHPTNDSIMWAGLYGSGVFKSTNRGASWTALGGGLPTASRGRVNLGIARSGPDTLFAAFHNSTTDGLLGIWRTPNGGTTWTQLAASNASCSPQCWYDMHVTVHPNTADTVFFGGIYLWRSTNGGASFGNVTSNIHVDQHFLAFDPQNPSVVYAANDGGVYRSTTGGTAWTSLNTGLALTQFYEGISLHPSLTTIIMGGTQDNGTLRYGGVPVWLHVMGGDGGFTAINQDDPGILYAETQWASFGGPSRSINGGGFVQINNGINMNDAAQFIPPLVMDPVRSSILYFGTIRLYRTTNGGDSWTDLTSSLGAGDITAIAPSASNPDAVYVATEQGAVYVSSDGGVSWPQRATGLPARYVQDIAVDRADWQTAYLVVSGFGTGHVFRTTNGGQTWTDRSSGLPNVPVNAVVLDPVDRGIVMIGTDLGVFMSVDSGGTWSAVQQGLPNVAVFDIAYNPATGALIAATHGRGMFQLQLNRALTLAVVPGERRDTVPVGNTTPRADSAAVVLSGTGAGAANWTAAHGAAAWVTLGTAAGTGAGTVRWTLNPTGLTQGTYVDTITVTAPGAGDSPFQLYAVLEVQGSLALGVSPMSRVDTAVAGSTTLVPDSATVTLSGTGGTGASWTASAGGAPWVTITTAGGTGSGKVRWSRSAAALGPGTSVATITVTAPGATGSPFAVVDSFVTTPAAAAFAPLATSGTGVSGAAAVSPGQAALVLAGGFDSTTAWTATHTTAPWVTLTTGAGTGSDTIRWERTAFARLPGTWVDTIRVVTAAGDTVRLADSFIVTAPTVAAVCAADHLLGTTCLDATALRWLDLAGNADGTFNLGDFLAFRARGGTAPPPPVVQRRQP